MKQTIRANVAPGAVANSYPGAVTRDAAWSADVESVKPMFRDRLASLEPQGLLAIGVRAILQEGGFAHDAPRRHCGCPSCAQRCLVCADRRC
jgi:hypothetical protein